MIFERPWLLVLLLLVVPVVWLASRTRAPLRRGQLAAATALSALAIVALVVALAGPAFLAATSRTTRVAIAGSDDPSVREAVRQWRAATPHGDPFHVVRAGARPVLAARGDAELPAAEPALENAAPDLGKALDLAVHLVPEHESGAIALFTDGSHAGSDPASCLAELTQRGVTLHARPVERTFTAPRLLQVTHAARVAEQEPFVLDATIDAPAAAHATLRVSDDQGLLASRDLELRRGVGTYAVGVVARGHGVVTLATELAAGPTAGTGQRERTALLVEGRPKVLQLCTGDGGALRATLEHHGIEVLTQDPAAGVGEQQLANADAVVVDDVAADAWPRTDQEQVRDAVLHHGLGLMLAGAHQNLGPGGYTDSPLAADPAGRDAAARGTPRPLGGAGHHHRHQRQHGRRPHRAGQGTGAARTAPADAARQGRHRRVLRQQALGGAAAAGVQHHRGAAGAEPFAGRRRHHHLLGAGGGVLRAAQRAHALQAHPGADRRRRRAGAVRGPGAAHGRGRHEPERRC